MYKILWFDDEHETLEDIKDDCSLLDIQLIGFGNAKDGIKALNEDPLNYDGILLDGMFFKSSEQDDEVDDSAFGEVAKTIGNLKAQGVILPWFIYSGQPSFFKDSVKLVNLFADKAYANGKIFDKNKPEDFTELCTEIKKAADEQPYTKARHNNPELMRIFELGYLPEVVEENVLDLLIKPLPSSNSELKDILTNIRSVQESCIVKLASIKVVHDSNDKFSRIMKHLSGNKTWSEEKKTLVPKSKEYQNSAIENLNKWIYHTCGTYIHYLDKQHFDEFMISNYAVESLRSGLFEVLLWFKKTYDEESR